MPKTLKEQLQDAQAKVAKLEAREPDLSEASIHELLDAAAKNLKENSFYSRGVDSKGIASLVRTAREELRKATKK